MSTMMESKGKVSAARRTRFSSWQWSRWIAMGTVALEAASAAARMRRPSVAWIAQGKTWIMRGERLVSAARTTATICSRL